MPPKDIFQRVVVLVTPMVEPLLVNMAATWGPKCRQKTPKQTPVCQLSFKKKKAFKKVSIF